MVVGGRKKKEKKERKKEQERKKVVNLSLETRITIYTSQTTVFKPKMHKRPKDHSSFQ